MRLLAFGLCVPAAFSASQAMAACPFGSPGTVETVAIGDTGRSVLVRRPASGSRAPLPLVMLFHGSGNTAAAIMRDSRLAETADAHGFIVAATDAGIALDRGFAWNIPGVPTIAGKVPTASDPDDVAFVGTAIDQLVASGCADRKRIYATGISGGGRMTSWLGCVAADRFAAIAPVVGLRAGNPLAADPARPDPATCRPSRPVPVLAFAGEDDTTNPVAGGGAGYWQYSMQTGLERWAALNECREGPTARALSPERWEYRWTQCRDDAEVVGHMVTGGGHSWVADNEAMWSFFSRYRR